MKFKYNISNIEITHPRKATLTIGNQIVYLTWSYDRNRVEPIQRANDFSMIVYFGLLGFTIRIDNERFTDKLYSLSELLQYLRDIK